MSIQSPAFDMSNVPVADAPTPVVPDHYASGEAPPSDVDNRTPLQKFIGAKRSEKQPPRAPKPRVSKVDPPYHKGMYTEKLMEIYAGIGATLYPFDSHCAEVILKQSEKCAESMDALAEKYPAVRRALNTLTTGGVIGAVIIAHAPIIVAVAQHHTPFVDRVQTMVTERMGANFDASPNGHKG